MTEFIVLDGVDQYPLLCLALAPPVIGAALLQSSPNPKFGGLGFLVLVFVPVILSPSNPQNYNPLSYLVVSLLATAGVLALAFWLTLLSPATDAQMRRWLLGSAKADLSAALRGRRTRSPPRGGYRSADRIGQIAAIGSAGDPARDAALADAFTIADLDHAVRRVRHAFARAAAVSTGACRRTCRPRSKRWTRRHCAPPPPAFWTRRRPGPATPFDGPGGR